MVKVCFARAVDALLSSQMQRLILIGLAIYVVLGGAGIVGIWWMRQNRMDSQWVPFPLHEQSSIEQLVDLQKRLAEQLTKPVVLAKVVADVGLQIKWGVASEQEVVNLLQSAVFVRQGEFKDPSITLTLSTMDEGVRGKYKEHVLLGKIAVSLGQQTRVILVVPESP
jgi:hypothetical protein